MENAIKKIKDINKVLLLANCFLNINIYNCEYNDEIKKNVNNYCPDIFKNSLRIPPFYLDYIKKYI